MRMLLNQNCCLQILRFLGKYNPIRDSIRKKGSSILGSLFSPTLRVLEFGKFPRIGSFKALMGSLPAKKFKLHNKTGYFLTVASRLDARKGIRLGFFTLSDFLTNGEGEWHVPVG